MNPKTGFLLVLFACITFSATAGDYVYVRSFPTYPNPLPIAVDVNPTSTTCYYATFPASGACNVVMVRDFLASTSSSDQTLIAGPTTFFGSRGYQGVAVDSSGNVYASGDNGGASPTFVIDKYNPNGSKTVWTLDGAFSPDRTTRYAGLGRINDSLLVVPSTVGASVRFINAATGATDPATIPAFNQYGRQACFNPDNNDLYIAHNDNGSTTPSLAVYVTGTPSTLAAYTLDTNDALGGGAAGPTATQQNGYDRYSHQLLHVNMRPSTAKTLEIYNVNPAVRGAAAIQTPPVQVISETTPGTPLPDVSAAVAFKMAGVSYLLVTSNGSSQIHVYMRQDDYEFVAGPKATTYDLGDGVTTAKVSNSDLINGVVGTVVNGGFHSAYTGGPAPITNGLFDADGVTALANDYGLTNPDLELEYPLSFARIDKIVIFAGHDGDGSRAYIDCQVSVDTGSGYAPLGAPMTTGPFGMPLPNATVVSDVVKYDPAGLATGVQKIKFSFYGVSNSFAGGSFVAPGPNAINGTIIKEIDVVGQNAPAGVADWLLYN